MLSRDSFGELLDVGSDRERHTNIVPRHSIVPLRANVPVCLLMSNPRALIAHMHSMAGNAEYVKEGATNRAVCVKNSDSVPEKRTRKK